MGCRVRRPLIRTNCERARRAAYRFETDTWRIHQMGVPRRWRQAMTTSHDNTGPHCGHRSARGAKWHGIISLLGGQNAIASARYSVSGWRMHHFRRLSLAQLLLFVLLFASLFAALARCRDKISARGSWIRSIAFSPDERILASGGCDGTVVLWALPTGRPIATFHVDRSPVHSLAFSPDGDFLASGNRDGVVVLWRVQKAHANTAMQVHGAPVQALAFSPDGDMLASGGRDGAVVLRGIRKASPITRFQVRRSPVEQLGFAPDGETLALGSATPARNHWAHSVDLGALRSRILLPVLQLHWVKSPSQDSSLENWTFVTVSTGTCWHDDLGTAKDHTFPWALRPIMREAVIHADDYRTDARGPVAVSARGKYSAVVIDDRVHVYELKTEKLAGIIRHPRH